MSYCTSCVYFKGVSGFRDPLHICYKCINASKYERKTIMEPKSKTQTQDLIDAMTYSLSTIGAICSQPTNYIPKIKNVIFNEPATIVFWTDGTKTVVKTQNSETYDPEKGLAMAIAKKALGNKGNYFNEIKKWTDTLPLYSLKVNIES